jgi:hypothetical protein
MPVITALPTEAVRALQSGGPDANGQIPERAVSDGNGNPCRHCLREIPARREMLILAYRPFPDPQPYAEIGPIFLCADACDRHVEAGSLPEVLTTSPDYLIKGYGANDRIVYGTGGVVPGPEIKTRAAAIFEDPRVTYIHVRSARNNCYQARIDRR